MTMQSRLLTTSFAVFTGVMLGGSLSFAQADEPTVHFSVSVVKHQGHDASKKFKDTLDDPNRTLPGESRTNKKVYDDSKCNEVTTGAEGHVKDTTEDFPRPLVFRDRSVGRFDRLFYKCKKATAVTYALFGDAAIEAEKVAPRDDDRPDPNDRGLDVSDRRVIRVVADQAAEPVAAAATCGYWLCQNGTYRKTKNILLCTPCQ